MSTDALAAQQAALDAEDAERHLARIAALYAELSEERERVRTLSQQLNAAKQRVKELGWDLQHRLDQAAKRRVKARDQATADALAAVGKKGGKGNGKG